MLTPRISGCDPDPPSVVHRNGYKVEIPERAIGGVAGSVNRDADRRSNPLPKADGALHSALASEKLEGPDRNDLVAANGCAVRVSLLPFNTAVLERSVPASDWEFVAL